MKKIILTGGGTAGHVTPNIALLPSLRRGSDVPDADPGGSFRDRPPVQPEGFEIEYIGSHGGIEQKLVEACGIPFNGISSGKLRRYVSFKNFTDIFRVVKGLSDASKIIRRFKPDIVFSKGGFVSVPVVIAAKRAGVPVVIHESDITPGLANRIAYPFASRVCASFPETMEKLPKGKGALTGAPIRSELFGGDRETGRKRCGFKDGKPAVLVMGGSLGSAKINLCLRSCLDALLERYSIIHICGKGNVDRSLDRPGYAQFGFVSELLPDLLAAADIAVSRSGANSIYELLALKLPNLLIPLSRNASRGDQIQNAESFRNQGFSRVIFEEDMTGESLVSEIGGLYEEREKYIAEMIKSPLNDGVAEVMRVITETVKM